MRGAGQRRLLNTGRSVGVKVVVPLAFRQEVVLKMSFLRLKYSFHSAL